MFNFFNDIIAVAGFESLILQGSALATVLACFVWLIKWLISNFTKALGRIEQSIHTNSMLMVTLTTKVNETNFTSMDVSDSDKGKILVANYEDTKRQLNDVAMALEGLIKHEHLR